jgi:hypothetical protein
MEIYVSALELRGFIKPLSEDKFGFNTSLEKTLDLDQAGHCFF